MTGTPADKPAPTVSTVRSRRTFDVGDLTDAQIEVLRIAEVPAEHAHLDAELDGSTPWR